MPRDTSEDRQARRAAALRQNLRRRKALERQRSPAEADDGKAEEGKAPPAPSSDKAPGDAR